MFEELVISGKTKPTNKRWTVFVSTVLQGSLLTALILVPLIFTEEMPKELLTTYLVAPPPPPPPPPPPAAAVQVVRRHTVEHLLHDNKLTAPTVIPKKINIIKEEADVPDVGNSNGVPGGVPGGTPGGVLNGVIGGVSSPVPPPPPPPVLPTRIRVGGNVINAKLKRQVVPIYPALARASHTSGVITLHAIIGTDGSIEKLTYISGPALFLHNAIVAVQEWKYDPTYLNGMPVEVETEIKVVFTLGESGD